MLAVASPSSAEPTASAANFVDAAGNRIWSGEPGATISLAADLLSQVDNEHMDTLAGVAFASDYSMIELYATDRAGEALAAAERAVGSSQFDSMVEVVDVEYSTLQLLDASRSIAAGDMQAAGILSVGPDIHTNTVAVGVSPEIFGRVASHYERVGEEAIGLSATDVATVLGVPYEGQAGVRIFIDGGDEALTRVSDSPPHYGGAWIDGPGRCSTGIPIRTDTATRRLLTAGHCNSGTFFNDGSAVGTTWTTTWPGNADIYGDWQLISGSSYSLRVYNGSGGSSSSRPITASNFGGRATGSQLCSSGRTTNQLCRLVVQSNYQTRTVNGVTVYPLIVAISDPDLDGAGTCTGPEPGDSGGPVYFSNSTGITVNGIVTSRSTVPGCRYTFTMLYGVRQWNPTASVS